MHIAMLIGTLSRGGAERVLVNLVGYLIGQGHQVTVITQYRKENEYTLDEKAKRIISDLMPEEITGNRLENFRHRFSKLREIWKKENPDIILSFIGKNNIMALLTSRGLGIPVAVSVRGEPLEEYYTRALRFLARNLFYIADGVILQTEQCRLFFPKGIRKKSVILKNPINPLFFREPFTGRREKTIVAVGRVDENKNHKMLMQAFARISGEFPDYRLIIYGEGEKRKELQELAGKLNLKNRISLPGNVDNVADAIYKSRIFVLPSNTEGMPNTLIEAMVMGLTVVSTDCPCGGPAELIDHGVNGLLTPTGDENALKESIRFLLNNLTKADEMGEKAGRISEVYRPEKVLREWENYLVLLTAKKNRR